MADPRDLAARCAALLAAGALIAGCGDGRSDDEVARVGDTPITKSELERTVKQIYASSVSPRDRPKTAVPDPPDSQQLEVIRDRALQTLISNEWIIRQAAEMGVRVTDEEIDAELDRYIEQAFGKNGGLEQHQKQTGLTRADLFEQLKVGQLTQKIRAKIVKDVPAVTGADVRRYYRNHRARFKQSKLDAVATQIKQHLVGQRESKVLAKFAKSFENQWREQTECAEQHVVAQCANAPEAAPGPDISHPPPS